MKIDKTEVSSVSNISRNFEKFQSLVTFGYIFGYRFRTHDCLQNLVDKFVNYRYFGRMENRVRYEMQLVFNSRILKRVIVDQHYRIKHPEIDDQLILRLVKTLDHGEYDAEKVVGLFEYYTIEPIVFEDLPYRLVLVICVHDDYLGVVNAFRVRRRKK